GAVAVAPLVERNDVEVCRQVARERVPAARVPRDAVEQEDGRRLCLSPRDVVEREATDRAGMLARGDHRPPHTSRARPTQRASLPRSSSTESSLPSTVEEKPHCGLTQSWSSPMYLAASSSRRLRSSVFSSVPTLDVTRPSTTRTCFGTWRSGEKSPERAS